MAFFQNRQGLANPNQAMLTQQLGQPVRGGIKPQMQTMQQLPQQGGQAQAQNGGLNPETGLPWGVHPQAQQPQDAGMINFNPNAIMGPGGQTPAHLLPQVPQQPQGGFNQSGLNQPIGVLPPSATPQTLQAQEERHQQYLQQQQPQPQQPQPKGKNKDEK